MKARNVAKIQPTLVPKSNVHRNSAIVRDNLNKLEIVSIANHHVDQHYPQGMRLCGSRLLVEKKPRAYPRGVAGCVRPGAAALPNPNALNWKKNA